MGVSENRTFWTGSTPEPRRSMIPWRLAGALLALAACALPVFAQEPFPEARPASLPEAIELLQDHSAVPLPCLTPEIQNVAGARFRAPVGLRRALSLLAQPGTLPGESLLVRADGTVIRYTTDETAIDRISRRDRDRDGTYDMLQAVLLGLDQAHALFDTQMELTPPGTVEIVLIDLPSDLDGYVIRGDGRPVQARIVLDASPDGGPDSARRAAVHQYAHAVISAGSTRQFAGWSEAFATWAALRIDGAPDAVTRILLSHRLQHLDEGLAVRDPALTAGNAIWLSFVDEAYGLHAVGVTMEELARPQSVAVALDRAIRRASAEALEAALREFHLWSLLVGVQSDGQHFPFAEQLEAPRFASTPEGLPALSVQADRPVASLGVTQVLLQPEGQDGGMRVYFEGEFSARWDVDLLLILNDGTKHRLSMPLTEGRGESTIPIQGLAEAWMLVRNLGGDPDAARHYSYAAHHERDYPMELSSLEATLAGPVGANVLVSWETASEHDLVGFNVLRVREAGGSVVTTNPIWVPALGDPATSTTYLFLDRSTAPGVDYIYRIEAITRQGLTSLSEPVMLRQSSP